MVSEAQTRIYIDEQLKNVGWKLKDPNNTELELRAKGKPIDYVLKNSLGHPIAVVEAKKFKKDARRADKQAINYAKNLKVKFIFLANGDEIYYFEYKKDPFPIKIKNFFSQDILERFDAQSKVKKNISTIDIDKKIVERDYQFNCLNKITECIENNYKKILIEMATGTGKTRLSAALIKRLFQSNHASKILFLCDRVTLAKQTEEVFLEYLTNYSCYKLSNSGFKHENQITISTLQTFIKYYDTLNTGYFDFIIIDECHRSIYGKFRRTLDHFSSIKIGLTATPCVIDENLNDNNEDKKFVRDTLKFFEVDKPNFVYSIREAINEKYLVPYATYKAKTIKTANENGVLISEDEIEWKSLSPKESEEIKNLFNGEKQILIDHSALERKITIPRRNQAIVDEFRKVLEEGFLNKDGEHENVKLGKTIVFAVSQKHAVTLAEMLDKKFTDLKEDKSVRYADYVLSDFDSSEVNDSLEKIKKFKREKYPMILVSVGMLDTGFDCPEVTNLIFARFTKSSILYRQMRGRGLRRADHIKKEKFWMFDFVGNTLYHGDDESYGEGGFYKSNSKPKGSSRNLVEIDINDWIDPTSREVIELDDEGKIVRPSEEQKMSDIIKFKFEEWINKKEKLDYRQQNYLSLINSYVQTNVKDINKISEADFTFGSFDSPRKGYEIFGGRDNFLSIIDEINTKIIQNNDHLN